MFDEEKQFAERCRENRSCVYCGCLSSCEEHFLPYSWNAGTRRRGSERGGVHSYLGNLVPSCSECNGIKSDKVFDTLDDAREYVHKRLSKKYRRILKTPPWSEDELNDLGPNLRKEVKLRLKAKKWVEDRLGWPNVEPDSLKQAEEIIKDLLDTFR